MRIALLGFALALIVLLTPGAAAATAPHLSIYFDPEYTRPWGDCPGYEIAYLYIVAEDFDVYVAGIEFAVEYPTEILWLADYDTPPVTIGTTPAGISMAWPLPQNGFSPFEVVRVIFLWNCDHCGRVDVPLCVKAHPLTGYVRATRFPDYEFVYATVQPACLCPTLGEWCVCPEPPVPVEDMSWGKIKELYR
jgi:hypothetical protein